MHVRFRLFIIFITKEASNFVTFRVRLLCSRVKIANIGGSSKGFKNVKRKRMIFAKYVINEASKVMHGLGGLHVVQCSMT